LLQDSTLQEIEKRLAFVQTSCADYKGLSSMQSAPCYKPEEHFGFTFDILTPLVTSSVFSAVYGLPVLYSIRSHFLTFVETVETCIQGEEIRTQYNSGLSSRALCDRRQNTALEEQTLLCCLKARDRKNENTREIMYVMGLSWLLTLIKYSLAISHVTWYDLT
jgi:hypothetical protein